MDKSPTMKKENPLAKKAFTLAVVFMIFQVIISFFRSQISFMVPPLMQPITSDLGIDLGLGGTLQTSATLMMGVGSLLVSLFIDRIGTSKSMTIGMAGYFIAGILGYTAQSFTPMLIARLITGLCNGFVIVCITTLVSERFTSNNARGMCSSLVQATNSLTTTAAFSITIPMYTSLGQSWNKMFMIWGASCLAIGIVWAIADYKPNKFFIEYNSQNAQNNVGAQAEEKSGNSILKALKFRSVWSAMICFTGATWLYMMFQTYLPTILQKVHQMEPQESSQITGLISLAGLISCVVSGLFIGKIKNYKIVYIALMVILPLACFGAINVKSELLLKIMVILVGVSFSVFVPVVNISIMTAAGMTSKVFAAANGCWTLLGNTLSLAMPFVFNALQKNMGMQNATSMMCLAGVLTVVGALIYPSNKKIKAQTEAKA